MGTKGYSFKCEKPFFVYFKKHYCPCCGQKLVRKKVTQVVSSRSDEAKNFNFNVSDISVKGDVSFTHIEFFCPSCEKQYTVKEIKDKSKK